MLESFLGSDVFVKGLRVRFKLSKQETCNSAAHTDDDISALRYSVYLKTVINFIFFYSVS